MAGPARAKMVDWLVDCGTRSMLAKKSERETEASTVRVRAVGYWLLGIGCWTLAVGCWPLALQALSYFFYIQVNS